MPTNECIHLHFKNALSQCPISSQEISTFVSLKFEFFFLCCIFNAYAYIHMYIRNENKINIFSININSYFCCFDLVYR